MNQIDATVTNIEQNENVSLVYFDAFEIELSMVSLELNEALEIGSNVKIGTKATNISLSKKIQSDLSISNQVEGIVKSVKNGKILSSIKVQVFNGVILESIISCKSAKKLNIKVAQKIVLLIKASDMAIVEIL